MEVENLKNNLNLANDQRSPLERFEAFTQDKALLSELLAHQSKMRESAEKESIVGHKGEHSKITGKVEHTEIRSCPKTTIEKMQGFIPTAGESNQLLYLLFLFNDSKEILYKIFPNQVNVIDEGLKNTLLLFTADVPPYDEDGNFELRATGRAGRYNIMNTKIDCISGTRSDYLKYNDSTRPADIKFENIYADGLLTMLEETFHIICMHELDTIFIEDITLSRDELTKEERRPMNAGKSLFNMDFALLEGTAAYIRYHFIFNLVNSQFAINHPKVLQEMFNSFNLGMSNINFERERIDENDEKFHNDDWYIEGSLKGKLQRNYFSQYKLALNALQNYFSEMMDPNKTKDTIKTIFNRIVELPIETYKMDKIKSGYFYQYLFGVELIGELIAKGWTIDRSFELFRDIKEQIGTRIIESTAFNLAPNSEYEIVKQQILKLIC